VADEGSDADRRADARRAIELKVEYKRLNTFFADYTKNISRGGTFIKTSRPLPVGTEFLFKLFVPGRDAPLTIHGEVQRIVGPGGDEGDAGDPGDAARPAAGSAAPSSDDVEPGMAIKFVYREGDPQEEIARAVEVMMTESLGPKLYARLMDQAQRVQKRRG
jgi:type IV pilus assembly protein PilZ